MDKDPKYVLQTALILSGIIFCVGLLFLDPFCQPASAEPYSEKFPDCTFLEGFVSNADDSTGAAKECLNSIHAKNLKSGALTLSEITEHCSQYNVDADLEKQCIDEYRTAEEQRRINISAVPTIIIFISAMGLILFGDHLLRAPTQTQRSIIAFSGYALVPIAIIVFVALSSLQD